jgi:hypothetical protein
MRLSADDVRDKRKVETALRFGTAKALGTNCADADFIIRDVVDSVEYP